MGRGILYSGTAVAVVLTMPALASDDGRHITGTTITIDNGETME